MSKATARLESQITMNKVVVEFAESDKQRNASRKSNNAPSTAQRDLKKQYEGWVPVDYVGAQLRDDVAHFWQLDASKYELVDGVAHTVVSDKTPLESLSATRFLLRKRPASHDHLHDLQQQVAVASTTWRSDPFWIQEKLFDIFLIFALPHWNGKGSITMSCYQFKQLILKATRSGSHPSKQPSSFRKNTHELTVRVVLAFKSATPNYSGAGASFEEFLDALVDVASYLFPRTSSEIKERALEFLATQHLIPFFDQFERDTVHQVLPTWSELDELVLARPKVKALLQRFSQPLFEIAVAYSTTNSGPRKARGLQFHEFSRFVHDVKPSSVPLNTLELCFCFMHCCRIDLAGGFSGPKLSEDTEISATSRVSLASLNTRTEGSGRGVLEVSCAHIAYVIAYLSLLSMPRLARTKTITGVQPNDVIAGDLSAPFSNKLAAMSIKAFLYFMSLRLSTTGRATALAVATAASPRFSSMKKDTTLPLVSVNFVQEFSRMHREDGLDDYVSSCGELMLQRQQTSVQLASDADDDQQQTDQLDESRKAEMYPEEEDEIRPSGKEIEEDLGLDIDWGDGVSETSAGQSSPGSESSPERSKSVVLTPLQIAQQRAHERNVLRSMLNDADEIYTFLAGELHQHAIENRLENAANVPQMLDIWVAAGQKYAQVINYLDSLHRTAEDDAVAVVLDRKVRVLERFGASLFVFAMQLLKSTTKVFKYEEIFFVTNARVYNHAKSDLWDDGQSATFTIDVATETLSLASGKLGQACGLLEELLQRCSSAAPECPPRGADDEENDSGDEDGDASEDEPLTVEVLTERYMQCLLQRANCLDVYGDVLAHNKPCHVDFDLGCALEEDHDLDQSDSAAVATLPLGAVKTFYSSTSVLSKSSSVGQFYREAKRIYRYLLSETQKLGWNGASDRWVPSIHDRIAMVEFKVATHLPRGCVAEKRLLDDAISHLMTLQRLGTQLSARASMIDCDRVDAKKEYVSAIRALRAKFFQPETEKSVCDKLDGEVIAPFYRFVLVAAIRELDPEKTGWLTQAQLSRFNTLCGCGAVEDSVMTWLVSNFDHTSGIPLGEPTLTEKGFFQYFCWLAEADPLSFCHVLDTLTAKYAETSASITSGIISQVGRELKGKSLRATLFNQGRSASLMPSLGSFSTKNEVSSGIADCVVTVSARMTAASCGDIASTVSPCDVCLEPMVLDALPLGADVPEELSKFCFPDDPFMSNESLPPKAFDIVLTDITGARRYGSCLQFYEEKDPIDVLAMISGVQRGSKSAGLPSWISLRDIQQRKSKSKCFIPKCICILSSLPLFQTFRDCLAVLYRLSISMAPFPIESFVFNILEQVQVPAVANSVTSFGLVDRIGLLSALPPAAPPLYPSEVDFTLLFQCLNAENIMKVYGYLLTERKVVLCSQNVSILTPIAETFRALLFPFECQVVYIPVLPLALLDFVTAPVPFFMGVCSDHSIDHLANEGVIVVYLDKDEVAEPTAETLPALPEVRAKKMVQALRKASTWAAGQTSRQQYGRFQQSQLAEITTFPSFEASDSHVSMLVQQHEDLQEKWAELHLLFTTFAMRLLKDFRKFCHRATNSDGRDTIVFDKKAFLVMHPSQRDFCVHLFQTQLFQRFIDNHESLSDSLMQLAASEAEQSWRNVRAKSILIRRNDNADAENAKYQPRKITRAPLPSRFPNGSLNGSFTAPTHRRRHSGRHTSMEILAPFNSGIYQELKGVSSGTSSETRLGSTTVLPSRPPLLSHGSSSTIMASSTMMSLPRGSVHSSAGGSVSSNLMVAARLRLDTPIETAE